MKDALVPPETWFTYEVIAQGKHIRLKSMARQLRTLSNSKPRHVTGHIALQQLREGSVVEFRKVEIKELPTAGTRSKSQLDADN